MAAPEIRRLGPGDEALLRATRLHALADAPEAFGTTFADAQSRDDEFWTAQVGGHLGDQVCATWVAIDDSGAGVGMVTGLESELVVEVIQVWVAPEHRGSGLIEQLFDRVVAWARRERIEIAVAESNARARRVYERLGFIAFRERQGPKELEIELTRPRRRAVG
jgi:RimJ/RimL family protein N-acetyltransferase